MKNSGNSAENLIHATALVESTTIGKGNRIWAFVHILPGTVMGNNCNICDHCFIEGNVKIGNNVTLKSGVHLWDGLTLKDDVFVGPGVAFTNDLLPRSGNTDFVRKETIIEKGASLGANSTILSGITIGEYAMTGIGSVVTRSVPSHALVFGNPARFKAWIDEKGEKMKTSGPKEWRSESGTTYIETPTGLKRK